MPLSKLNELAKMALEEIVGEFIDLRFKKMFGSIGVYGNGDSFFAVISEGIIFIRTDEKLASKIRSMGGQRLVYLKNFFSLSNLILEDEDLVRQLVKESLSISAQSKPKNKKMTQKQKKDFLESVLQRRS